MTQQIKLPPLPEWADRTLQGEDRDSLFAWASAAIEADRQATQNQHAHDIPKGSGDPVWQTAMAHRRLTQAGVPTCNSECFLSVWGRVVELLRMNGLRLEGGLGEPIKCVSDRQANENLTIEDYEEVLADHRRLVRELDVLLNGEEGAAKQASLCDIVAQVRRYRQVRGNADASTNSGEPVGWEFSHNGYWIRTSEADMSVSEIKESMQDYARAAIEADRQRGTAKQRYDSAMEGSMEADPIERLRFYCSLAMSGQDWLDVEPFFDAMIADRKRRGEPIAWIRVAEDWSGAPKVVIAKPGQEGAKPVYLAPQPAEPSRAPTLHSADSGAQNGIQATQAAPARHPDVHDNNSVLVGFADDAQPAASAVPECSCEACQPNTWGNVRMIVCAICGNKRCPHATDHRNHCTGSNEPGQKGSS